MYYQWFMGIKVLFIYPNSYGMNMLPPAIALFSALLKREGHKVEIFDTTYYKTDQTFDSDGSKEDMPDEDPNCTLSINNVQNSHNHDHNKDEMR